MSIRACVIVAALLTGCAQKSVYLPIANSGVTVSGQPAARWLVPPARPEGSIAVAAVGTKQEGASRVVTVRVVVDNRSGESWAVDPQRQQLTIDRAPNPPTVVAEEIEPQVIPPGAARAFDFHFLVPGEAPPTGFRVAWELATPLEVVRRAGEFRRAPVGAGYAHGPPMVQDGYYYEPFFVSTTVPPRAGIVGPEVRPAPHPRYQGRRAVEVPARPFWPPPASPPIE